MWQEQDIKASAAFNYTSLILMFPTPSVLINESLLNVLHIFLYQAFSFHGENKFSKFK